MAGGSLATTGAFAMHREQQKERLHGQTSTVHRERHAQARQDSRQASEAASRLGMAATWASFVRHAHLCIDQSSGRARHAMAEGAAVGVRMLAMCSGREAMTCGGREHNSGAWSGDEFQASVNSNKQGRKGRERRH